MRSGALQDSNATVRTPSVDGPAITSVHIITVPANQTEVYIAVVNPSGSTGTVDLPPLDPGTEYYLSARNTSSSSITSVVNFSMTLSAETPTFTALQTNATTEVALDEYETVWYTVAVTGGQTYSLTMDNGAEGSGGYSTYATVSAYGADKKTSYFEGQYYAYETPLSIVVPTGESTVYIAVSSSDSTSGAITLRMQ